MVLWHTTFNTVSKLRFISFSSSLPQQLFQYHWVPFSPTLHLLSGVPPLWLVLFMHPYSPYTSTMFARPHRYAQSICALFTCPYVVTLLYYRSIFGAYPTIYASPPACALVQQLSALKSSSVQKVPISTQVLWHSPMSRWSSSRSRPWRPLDHLT